jgi:hypothetical protein
MVDEALLTTRNDGPASAIFPVQVTSIMRALPFASQGLARLASPLVPDGQSWTGPLALALAVGAGALVEGAGAGTAADAVALGALGVVCSLSQPDRSASAAVVKTARER